MANKVEMSLDDIIKSNKPRRGVNSSRRGGARESLRRSSFKRPTGGRSDAGRVQKGRGRGGISRNIARGDINSAWKHDLFEGYDPRKVTAAPSTIQLTMGSTKLVLSNLGFEVSDSDIQDLFAEFGPLKSAAVHYDRSGRSMETAEVIYERKSDAIKAMKQYNGVPLDGRAMHIQLATSFIPEGPQRRLGGEQRAFDSSRNSRRGGGNRGRPTRGSGRTNFKRQNKRKPPTAEELDAELDAYTEKME